MLRGSHDWSLLKLNNISLKEFSEAVSKSTKNVKINTYIGNFH